MNKRKKRTIIFIIIIILIALLIAWTVWSTVALQLNSITIQSDRLPASFSGYRIAAISDLHNTELGKDNNKLLDMLKSAQPDIITITGDVIDSRNTDVDIALKFAEQAVQIAPCYYVTGNHEARVDAAYEQLESGLIELGVTILHDEAVTLEKNGESVILLGLDDPSFAADAEVANGTAPMIDSKLKALKSENTAFTILLSHRPELFDIYAQNEIDLTLSGHAHGGQIRIPFIGAIIAPNQGFFPEYDTGLYSNGDCNMVVSRGIGNSVIPFRFNNRPEVVLIKLEKLC